MTNKTRCEIHGESQEAFICRHLIMVDSTGLGFNRDEPDGDHFFPDAWCDECEIIRADRDGLVGKSEMHAGIKLVCSECYERARIRNTRPVETLDSLAGLRWKCGRCEKWHAGPILDYGYEQPYYWQSGYEKAIRWNVLPSGKIEKPSVTFLDHDYCAINDEYFFVRGLIQLPIFGSAKTLNWGVWGSVSRANFEVLMRLDCESNSERFSPIFSWLSSRIYEYPDTLNLKMSIHLQGPKLRPLFRPERLKHPLSQEYHHGITPARVKEIMFGRLPSAAQYPG